MYFTERECPKCHKKFPEGDCLSNLQHLCPECEKKEQEEEKEAIQKLEKVKS